MPFQNLLRDDMRWRYHYECFWFALQQFIVWYSFCQGWQTRARIKTLLCHLRGHWKVEPNSSKITAMDTVTTGSFRKAVVHSQLLMDEMAQWMATAYAAFISFECENGTAAVLQCYSCVLASSSWKWMPFVRIPYPQLLVQTLPKCLNRHLGCSCSTPLLEENASCFDPFIFCEVV